MTPKLIKLPDGLIDQITAVAIATAKSTGEPPNFSAAVRDLLRSALAAALPQESGAQHENR